MQHAMRPRIAAVVLALAAAWCAAFPPAAATEIQRVRSPGGIEAWLVEDRSVPVISLRLSFRGGAALDPAGKEGLAGMVAGLLDEGAGDLDSQAFQEAIDDIAASLSFEAGLERFGGTLRTLSEHRARAFALLRKALTAPRFDAEPVERIRRQIVAGLASDRGNPRWIAGRNWYRLVFGEHPYARPAEGTPEGIAAIAAEDLERFVRDRLVRRGLTIGVAGDIAAAELAERLDEVFGALPVSGPAAEIADPPPPPGRLQIVRKAIPQSVVFFGQAGLKRHDPDYYAAYVMNYILGGGGLTSRLNEELREKRGLVYSVYSYLYPLERAGLIAGRLATANARVGTALDLLRGEWAKMAREGVSEEELAAAKRYLNGSFPLRLDSTRSIAGMLVAIQVNRLGIDYVDRRSSLIDAVTAADVRRVAQRLLSPDRLAVVVVGSPEGIGTAQYRRSDPSGRGRIRPSRL